MKKLLLTIVVPLACLIISSCNSQNDGGSSPEPEKFTYFDDKVYSSLSELENDLFDNWIETDDVYSGYYQIKFEMGYNEFSEGYMNFGKNASVRNLLLSQGKQFVYDMSYTRHLIYQDIVKLLVSADAFLVNKYAVYNGHNRETEFGVPIYFGNTWWGYDDWQYSNSGTYGWKDYDIGKRILANLSSYVSNSDYQVDYASFYVTKNTYNSETLTFNGQAYAYAQVKRLSTNRIAYQKYRINLETKTVSAMSAVYDEYADARDNNLIWVS